MSFKYKFIIFMVILIYSFPFRVYAKNWSLNFLAFDNYGTSYWVKEEISFDSCLSIEEKAEHLFNKLFSESIRENTYNFPKSISINSIIFIDDLLVLDVSEEILNYNGGSYNELILKSQIVKTALNIEGINRITLLIEGDIAQFKKGLLIYEISVWEDIII